MRKREASVWDILAWVALAGILIWVILKTFGVINTAAILGYAPIYAAVYLAGWQIHKLSVVSEDVKDLKRFRSETIQQINEIKLNCMESHK